MSVNSLLSQTLSTGSGTAASPDHSSPYCISETEILRDEFINYGHDHGHADLDLYNGTADLTAMMLAPNSHDGNSTSQGQTNTDVKPVIHCGYAERASSPESDGDSHSRPVTVFSKGGYYASPVPVNIPRFLMPLPTSLTLSPINLLYFHHFLNHTGKILAPHACNHNPFTTVLPRMAITNQNLLNLLLAYSASHRSRLIGHPEPSHRIAHWVQNVFPSLRHALSDSHQRSSPATLATAIMLVSLKIISPSTFEVPISWQDHLKLARELYVFYRKAHVGRPPTQVGHFLSNWFGYIDILGSISCEDIAPPVPGVYYPPDMTLSPLHDDDEDWEIECYSGFTPRTGATMFRLAELIGQSKDNGVKTSPNVETKEKSGPSGHIAAQAEQLLQDMLDDRLNVHKRHTSHDNEDLDASASVPRAIDDAYQLACIIHLYRRVFGKLQLDPAVCKAIDELMSTLDAGVSYATARITIPAIESLPSAPTAHQALTTLKSHVRQRTHWLTGITASTFLTAYRLASKANGRKHPFLVYVSTLAVVGGWGIQSWYEGGVVYDALKKPIGMLMKGVTDIAHKLGFEDVLVVDTNGNNASSAGWNWSYGLGCLPPTSQSNVSPSIEAHSRSSSSSSTTTLGAGGRNQYTPSVSIATLPEEEASASLAGSGVFVVNRHEEEEEEDREAMTPPVTSRPITNAPNGESVARMLNSEKRLQEDSMKTLGIAFAMAVVGIWGDCY
ncbi:hypothetical protein KEM56_001619 [Ascosphaera pollenicola]|nr:hypothetical protein KEM56_001619 [Ascosphaera pollenicola]